MESVRLQLVGDDAHIVPHNAARHLRCRKCYNTFKCRFQLVGDGHRMSRPAWFDFCGASSRHPLQPAGKCYAINIEAEKQLLSSGANTDRMGIKTRYLYFSCICR
jgi:hypothetical protein